MTINFTRMWIKQNVDQFFFIFKEKIKEQTNIFTKLTKFREVYKILNI